MSVIEHGGNLRQAAARYGRPVSDWIDCSTGILPDAFPLLVPPREIWQRLPEDDDGLELAARQYYGVDRVLAVPGTQWAIQQLPEIRLVAQGPAHVGIVAPTYGEHAWQWQRMGHHVTELAEGEIEAHIDALDVLVCVNPNNPTGTWIERHRLAMWHRRLADRQGWLIVDEAFVDCELERGLGEWAGQAELILLRSIGKFFGLAGIRLGFVLTSPEIGAALAEKLGPWAVSHPARWAGRSALSDSAWQRQTRIALVEQSGRLDVALRQAGFFSTGGTGLFRWCPIDQSRDWQQRLAQQGIWVRAFDQPSGLRFGLPPLARWAEFDARLAVAASAA